jgi:ATP-dependent DNA helicase RecG
MVLQSDILKIAASGESYRVERTISTKDTDKFCQAICAFANDLPKSGMPGYLLIGVSDDGILSGLKVTDELLKNITAIRSDGNILPVPQMTTEKFSFPEGDILVVEVQPSYLQPVRYRGRVWVRIGPRKDIASDAEERVLTERRTAAVTTFDTMPCIGMTAEALDMDLFNTKYLKRAMPEIVRTADKRSAVEQMAALRLFCLDRQCPTYAGLLLLGNTPKYTLHGAYIQYVRFGGKTNGSPVLNELRFEENILTLIPRLDDFLDAAVIQRWPVPISTMQEKMVYNYPRWAIRELLMNAIMHRDYQSNAPIRLYQYEDRIEIMNPGGLYGNAQPENFPLVNDYRNPVIAEALKVMDYVNMFSRGVGRVQEMLHENGNGDAIFDLNKITVFNVLIKENPEDAALAAAQTRGEKSSEKTPLKTPLKTPGKTPGKTLGKTPRKIMELLSSSPALSIPEIALTLSKSESAVERAIRKLREDNLLRRVGPAKGGHWEVLGKE